MKVSSSGGSSAEGPGSAGDGRGPPTERAPGDVGPTRAVPRLVARHRLGIRGPDECHCMSRNRSASDRSSVPRYRTGPLAPEAHGRRGPLMHAATMSRRTGRDAWCARSRSATSSTHRDPRPVSQQFTESARFRSIVSSAVPHQSLGTDCAMIRAGASQHATSTRPVDDPRYPVLPDIARHRLRDDPCTRRHRRTPDRQWPDP